MTILIVEDDPEHAFRMQSALSPAGEVLVARALDQAEEIITRQKIDLTVLDAMFPRSAKAGPYAPAEFLAPDVLDALARRAPGSNRQQRVLMVTGNPETTRHVAQITEWLRSGRIFNLIPKSLVDAGWELFETALRHQVGALRSEDALSMESSGETFAKLAKRGIVTRDPRMIQVWSYIQAAAAKLWDYPVIIQGPRGSGKELVVRAIHSESRPNEGFVALNMSAQPADLFESEMFGSEKGAYTNATQRRDGWMRTVGRGTLFLDEIGYFPLHLQPRLLRVIEQRTFHPIGAREEQRFLGRILVATSAPIDQLVAEGKFLPELYDRLNTITITLPPLADRARDIPDLLRHFLDGRKIEPGAEALLCEYAWPGNVRELQMCVVRLLALCPGPIAVADIRQHCPGIGGARPIPRPRLVPPANSWAQTNDQEIREILPWIFAAPGAQRILEILSLQWSRVRDPDPRHSRRALFYLALCGASTVRKQELRRILSLGEAQTGKVADQLVEAGIAVTGNEGTAKTYRLSECILDDELLVNIAAHGAEAWIETQRQRMRSGQKPGSGASASA